MRKTLCGALVVAALLAIGCGSKPAEEPTTTTPEPVATTPAPATVDTTAVAPATTDTTAAATN